MCVNVASALRLFTLNFVYTAKRQCTLNFEIVNQRTAWQYILEYVFVLFLFLAIKQPVCARRYETALKGSQKE